jgi:hypothetical protein
LFRKMNQGRLFQLPQRPVSRDQFLRRPASHGMEYFWLCDQCRLLFTLSFRPDSGVVVVPMSRLVNAKTARVTAESLTRIQPIPGGIRWNA